MSRPEVHATLHGEAGFSETSAKARGELMIAPCGFRCDRCVAFTRNARTQADRVRGSTGWATYWGLRVPPERIQCHGCPEGPVAGLQFPDSDCEIRPCVLGRGLATCAECGEYPCQSLRSRMAACDKVVTRCRDQVPERDFARFIAPYDCRTTFDGLRKGQPADPRPRKGRKDR